MIIINIIIKGTRNPTLRYYHREILALCIPGKNTILFITAMFVVIIRLETT